MNIYPEKLMDIIYGMDFYESTHSNGSRSYIIKGNPKHQDYRGQQIEIEQIDRRNVIEYEMTIRHQYNNKKILSQLFF